MTVCTIFTGARIFDGAQFHDRTALVVRAGHVAGIVPRSRAPEGEVVALGCGILAPGFLDLQVNGGGGVMLGGPEVKTPANALPQIRRICAAHGALGAKGLLPTLINDRPEVTAAVLEAGAMAADEEVPGFLGLHIEGPHLDPRRKGAHDPALIRPMEAADLDRLCRAAGRICPRFW